MASASNASEKHRTRAAALVMDTLRHQHPRLEAEIAAALACVEAETLERAAQIAARSNFSDGPKGTIEGRIARAIRALASEPSAATPDTNATNQAARP